MQDYQDLVDELNAEELGKGLLDVSLDASGSEEECRRRLYTHYAMRLESDGEASTPAAGKAVQAAGGVAASLRTDSLGLRPEDLLEIVAELTADELHKSLTEGGLNASGTEEECRERLRVHYVPNLGQLRENDAAQGPAEESEWVQQEDPATGNSYYVNTLQRTSTWTQPAQVIFGPLNTIRGDSGHFV